MRIWLSAAMTLVATMTAGSVSAAGPSVELTIQNGRVWLASHDATPGEILAVWARVGQTTVVNAENAPGRRLTLEMRGVSEQEALDAILRSAAGFVARTRAEASLITGSRFDRIVVLPVSQPPAFAAAVPPAPLQQLPPQYPTIAPGVQRIVGADGQPVADDQEGAPPRRSAASMPPGFSPPPQPPPRPQPATSPQQRPPQQPAPSPQQVPVGVPVPGMIVAPPLQPAQPQRPPR
jgi:hypothetical protein